MKIGVVSCGGSNVTSVVNALIKIGYDAEVMNEPGKKVDFLIMPGVGTFESGMQRLNKTGFSEFIMNHINKGNPFIGICLGMQILFKKSDECPFSIGLSHFNQNIKKLHTNSATGNRVLPNIGYNFVEFASNKKERLNLFDQLSGYYYFLHSFALREKPESFDILGATQFNNEYFFPFLLIENTCGIQFHPERSGNRGLKLLTHTIELMKIS